MVPGTVLLFRQQVYDYSCRAPEETVMMVSNFCSPRPEMVLTSVEGDASVFAAAGPPPPQWRETLDVMNMSTRLGGQSDCKEHYHSMLFAATDCMLKVPIDRWDVDAYYHDEEEPSQPYHTNIQHQGHIEGVALFDNKYFEISAAESAGMDPVQRQIMEVGGTSAAMIGHSKKQANRRSAHAGVSVGNDKLDWMFMPKDELSGAMGATSTVLAIIANRFSFVYNLKGPSFVCDTACSASLVSTHCAKMSMLERTVDPLEWWLSLGAHLVLMPFISFASSHMGSPQGLHFRCVRNAVCRNFRRCWSEHHTETPHGIHCNAVKRNVNCT